MILVTIKHMDGKRPGAVSFSRGRKPRSENGFAPGVNWLVKYQGSVPKEYLLVETTEGAGDASRGFWEGGKWYL